MSPDEKIELRVQRIWRMAAELQVELDRLDDLCNSRSVQFAALQSCQGRLGEWRGFNLGELMNLFGIPPEFRDVIISKGVICEQSKKKRI